MAHSSASRAGAYNSFRHINCRIHTRNGNGHRFVQTHRAMDAYGGNGGNAATHGLYCNSQSGG